ncbi:MAG: hypothetical protein U0359_11400 [Byssovorax sp.]
MPSLRSPRLRAALLAAGALAAVLGAARPGRADDTPGKPLDPDAGTPRPAAPDTRTGHLFIYPRVSFTGGVGSLASVPDNAISPRSTSARDTIGAGLGVGGVIGVGIGRSASLQVDGGYSLFQNPSACLNCSGSSVDVGLGLTYHLIQGIAVDPWATFGMGVRSQQYTVLTNITDDQNSTNLLKQSYFGYDFARLSMGADFYPTPVFGLGLYLEADVGTNLARPDPTTGPSVYSFLHLGARLAFDPFRRAAPRPAQTQARRE